MSETNRGWELVHDAAETLQAAVRNEFVADARNAEGAFTRGLISEETFLLALKVIADGYRMNS